MAKKSTAQAAKAKRSSDTAATRAARSQEESAAQQKKNAPARKARDIRNQALRDSEKQRRDEMLDAHVAEDAKAKKAEKPTLLDGKPGSGAGLKPGDLFAPKSNPGAAARVPMQPLSPDSKQSHGKGILYDKDLDNGAFAEGDPEAIDAAPSGSNPDVVDKDAEVKKAEKATARSRMTDPDNPTTGYKGGDATASPNPIGTHRRSKSDIAGGSNSGSDL